MRHEREPLDVAWPAMADNKHCVQVLRKRICRKKQKERGEEEEDKRGKEEEEDNRHIACSVALLLGVRRRPEHVRRIRPVNSRMNTLYYVIG